MGQDTEIMSRYTLSNAPENGTEIITFSVPNDQPGDQTLTVHMGFSSDGTHKLSMRGYGDSSNFADGLEIVDTTKTLTKLKLALDSSWPEGWTITVDPDTVLRKGSTPHVLSIQPESKDWEVSVTISATTSNGTTITTGDPKIKVIRPTS